MYYNCAKIVDDLFSYRKGSLRKEMR